jgi:hypothetical protein
VCYFVLTFFTLNIHFFWRNNMAGFQLVKTQGGGSYTGKVQTYCTLTGDASLMAIGDAVIEDDNANTDGIQALNRANGGTGTEITGVITGFAPDISNLELKGRTASTARIVKVQTDPNAVYELEIGSALTVTSVGENFLLTATGPTTAGSLIRSAMVSGATDASGPLRCVGLVKPTDGTAIGAVGNIGRFTLIRSQLTNLTGV